MASTGTPEHLGDDRLAHAVGDVVTVLPFGPLGAHVGDIETLSGLGPQGHIAPRASTNRPAPSYTGLADTASDARLSKANGEHGRCEHRLQYAKDPGAEGVSHALTPPATSASEYFSFSFHLWPTVGRS